MAKSQQSKEVTLVGTKGVQLPFTTGTVAAESGDSLVFNRVEKSGRGRGVKLVHRQYTIPYSSISYYYTEQEAEDADGGAAVATAAAPKAPKAPGKKSVKADASDNSEVTAVIMTTVTAAIMTTLREAGEPMGMGAIAGATGMDPKVLRPVLKELAEAGKVNREGEKRGTVYFVKGAKAKKADPAPVPSKAPKAPKVPKAPGKKSVKADASDNSEVTGAIMTALQEAGEPVGMGAIAGATGMDPKVLRPVLKELAETGAISRTGEKRGTVYGTSNGVTKKATSAAKRQASADSDAGSVKASKGASLFDETF